MEAPAPVAAAPVAPAQRSSAASSPAIPAVSAREISISEATAPAPATRPGSMPSLSESEIAHLSRQVGGRDPEASLDIPPPTEVEPPEKRAPDARDPYIGTTFDHRYKIDKLLGEGGMGFVYLARHKVIDKKVAVKVLRADLAKDREILDRFLQEAKAASSIGNPHIVDISDFGDLPDGSTYFVMEFLEGKALTDRVEEATRLPVDIICHIGLQLCAGLSAAHARGIVHRDLKPDNIFLLERGTDHDFVKILDFGIAKVSSNADTKLTKAGAVFGTPHYMSPEQAAGSPVDHRTDIYALGVILYEMVAGQLPFNADNFMGILTQHMYKAPVPIRALVPGPECPPSLEAVVLKCLSKKPEGRYQSMDELAADLDRVKSGGVPIAVAEMMGRSGGFNVPADYFKTPNAIVPATPPSAAKKWSRNVWIAGTVAAVAIVGGIFAIARPSTGTPSTTKDAQTAVAPTVVTVTVQAPPPPPPPPAKKTIAVAVGGSPDTASVYRDGTLVHQVPCSIEVEDGKTVTIEVRADHYETQTLTLDGSETSKAVKLAPVKGWKPVIMRPTGAGTGSGTGSKGKSDVRDPWGK
jgi:serine/threonine-protein kinase